MTEDKKSKLSPLGRHWFPLVGNSSRMKKYMEESSITTTKVTRSTNTTKYNGVIVSPNQKDNFLF